MSIKILDRSFFILFTFIITFLLFNKLGDKFWYSKTIGLILSCPYCLIPLLFFFWPLVVSHVIEEKIPITKAKGNPMKSGGEPFFRIFLCLRTEMHARIDFPGAVSAADKIKLERQIRLEDLDHIWKGTFLGLVYGQGISLSRRILGRRKLTDVTPIDVHTVSTYNF